MTQQHNIQSNIIIRVFSGLSVEHKCGKQFHPINEVKRAEEIISLTESIDVYSNSPDFVSAIKYLCQRDNIKVEFFLDGKSYGDNIEPVFSDFNKSLDMINEFMPKSEH